MGCKISPANTRKFWFSLGLLFVGYAVFDFWASAAAAPLLDGTADEDITIPLVGALAGCLLAQFGVIAAWGVLGLTRPGARWLGGLVAAALLLSLALLGAAVGQTRNLDWWFRRELFRLLPAAYLGAQIPIWALNLRGSFRLATTTAVAPAPRTFTLRGVFLATGIVAATLGLMVFDRPAQPASDILASLAVCMLCFAAFSLLTVVPCLLSVFWSRTPRQGALFLLAYIGLLPLGALIAQLTYRVSGGFEEFLSLPVNCAVIVSSITITLFGSFSVLRHCGVVLLWGKPEPNGD